MADYNWTTKKNALTATKAFLAENGLEIKDTQENKITSVVEITVNIAKTKPLKEHLAFLDTLTSKIIEIEVESDMAVITDLEFIGEEEEECVITYYSCPKCSFKHVIYRDKYCSNCGKEIKWKTNKTNKY